jgi:hypothetical protein
VPHIMKHHQRARRVARGFALCLATLAIFAAPQVLAASDSDAEIAITRADAKVEMVAKSGAPVTQNSSFMLAQQKLNDARNAYDRNRNEHAEWYAQESEVWAEVAAQMIELDGLENTRIELDRSVAILDAEIRTP